MNFTVSDWIGIAGVAATIFLGIVALWQNARYKKQSDNFVDLQSMPELYPVRRFDFGFSRVMEKPPMALKADISGKTGNVLYFSVFYAQNVPIYDLRVSAVEIDGKRMDRSLTSDCIDIYPMNVYLQFSLEVPGEYTCNREKHEGQVVFLYKNQYNVTYEKKLTFEFTGTQVSAENMERAKRTKKKARKE